MDSIIGPNTIGINVDYVLQIIGWISLILFVIFIITWFIRTLIREGLLTALLEMLSFRVLIPLLIVLGLNLLSASIIFVQPPTVGVVVSAISPGGVRPEPMRSGLHWIIPLLEEVAIYPIYWQTYTMSARINEGENFGEDAIRARTSDGQEVWLDTSVIFRINVNQVIQVHIDWQERYTADFIRPLVQGQVRTEVAKFTVDEVNSSKRGDLETALNRLLEEEFSDKGLLLDQFLLRDITFSQEYAESVERKQVALQQVTQAEREARQMERRATGRANAIRIEAQGQAEALKLIGDALNANPDLVTYHYVDRLSPNIRVMLVPSNNPLILPLPDLDEVDTMTNTVPITDTLSTPTLPATLTQSIDLPTGASGQLPFINFGGN